jgi:tetratricopeptide (TPR) repeat protein
VETPTLLSACVDYDDLPEPVVVGLEAPDGRPPPHSAGGDVLRLNRGAPPSGAGPGPRAPATPRGPLALIRSALARLPWSGARRARREAEARAEIDRGRRRYEQDRVDGAIAAFREAIRLDPDNDEAHLCLGMALVKEDPAGAIAALGEAIRLRPDSGAAHLNLGHALINRGEVDGAIPAYREAIRLLPDDPLPRATLAFELLTADRPRPEIDEVLPHARRAAELAPSNGIFLSILAWTEYRTDHRAEAIAAAERAMGSGGPYSQANIGFILAGAHGHRGDRDEASGWFDLAVIQAEEQRPVDRGLRRLWAEAAELLGRPGPDAGATGDVRPAGPADGDPH